MLSRAIAQVEYGIYRTLIRLVRDFSLRCDLKYMSCHGSYHYYQVVSCENQLIEIPKNGILP